MNHLSTTEIRLDIREFDDPLSESGRAWIIDLLGLNGAVIIEGAGVSAGLPFAISEAGNAIALWLANEWSMNQQERASK